MKNAELMEELEKYKRENKSLKNRLETFSRSVHQLYVNSATIDLDDEDEDM
jgi:predicted RNase H-like nuclease (RuvC/YqgF family)